MLQFHFYGAHWKDIFEPNKSYLLKVNNISECMNEWRECSFIKNELLKFKFKTKPSVRKELIQHTPVVCFHTSITVFAWQLANRDTEFMRHPVYRVSYCLCATCDFGTWVGSIQMIISHRKIGQNSSIKNRVVDNCLTNILHTLFLFQALPIVR